MGDLVTSTVPATHLWSIPPGTKPSKCKGCGATIYWVRTPKGKNMPVDEPTSHDFEGFGLGVAHWGTCPVRDQFKRPK